MGERHPKPRLGHQADQALQDDLQVGEADGERRALPAVFRALDQSPSDVKLAFPNDIKFNASGIGQCAEGTIMNGGSCPSADIVGKGISRIYGPMGNSLLPLLTVYNGRSSSTGTPTVILQGEFPPNSGLIDGTFSKKTGGTLDIKFPTSPAAGPS